MRNRFIDNLVKVSIGVCIGFAVGVPTGAVINGAEDATVPAPVTHRLVTSTTAPIWPWRDDTAARR